ncbi:ras-like protein 3 [Histomonas meleagridis]|uniref:ras-like protein 3 n=1 Tax=Histomonas meleagridis TaxID=135588 RepID=UPI0035597423|nr:ras-like protein 3 [Histomonas meleagridis]
MKSNETCKVLVMGYPGSGKTSLIRRFVDGIFSYVHVTVMSDEYHRFMEINNKGFDFEITDISGSEPFHGMLVRYAMSHDCFIICYAIDDHLSFKYIKSCYDAIKKAKKEKIVPIVICGNKCDLEDQRVVSKFEGSSIAKRLNVHFFETSALANVNIENPFIEFAQYINKNSVK